MQHIVSYICPFYFNSINDLLGSGLVSHWFETVTKELDRDIDPTDVSAHAQSIRLSHVPVILSAVLGAGLGLAGVVLACEIIAFLLIQKCQRL